MTSSIDPPITIPTVPSRRGENLRLLWTFVHPHRVALLVGILLGLVATGASLASPLVTKWVLDSLDSSLEINTAVFALVGLLIVGSVVEFVQLVLLGQVAENIVLDARRRLVRRMFRLRIGDLASRSSGELTTRVTSDTVLLRQAASTSVVGIINSVVGIIGAVTLMAILDWVLLATTLASLSLVVVAFAVLMPRLATAQTRAQEAVGRLGGRLEGSLRAIRTVKTSQAEDRESDSVLIHAQESANQSIRAVRLGAVVQAIARAGIQLAIIAILGVGAYRVSEDLLAVSSLIAFLLYAFQLAAPIGTLTGAITQLQSGIAAARRIQEIESLDIEPTSPVDSGTSPCWPTSEGDRPDGPVISLDHVTARYAPDLAPAISDVTLTIPRTGHIAIVGPSGAGKSTMFSLMLGFLRPEQGDLLLDGISYDRRTLASIRERIAYVEQDGPLLPGTLRDNLAFSYPEVDDAAIWDALRSVQLDERVHSLPNGLDTAIAAATVSGGERQRIALARVLVGSPRVLLLDEATAQLDGLTEAAVQACIARVARSGAVVTIAHRLSTVLDADQIILMEGGSVRARGTHADLLETDDLYRRLVESLRIVRSVPSVPPVAA